MIAYLVAWAALVLVYGLHIGEVIDDATVAALAVGLGLGVLVDGGGTAGAGAEGEEGAAVNEQYPATCATCPFYQRRQGPRPQTLLREARPAWGECRQSPPPWESVNEDDWCAEHPFRKARP